MLDYIVPEIVFVLAIDIQTLFIQNHQNYTEIVQKIRHIKYDFKLFLNNNISIILSCTSATLVFFSNSLYTLETLFSEESTPVPKSISI